MAKKETPPSVDEILELYDSTKKRYEETGLWNTFERDEKIYELDFKSELLLPKEFEKEGIVLPTARDLVDTCCDHTDIYNARIWVNKKGTSPKSDEEANLLRKFGLGVLYRNNVEASISPIRVGAKHYWIHGMTVIKTVWDADRWMDKPEQKKNESEEAYGKRIDTWRSELPESIPIVIQAVHPRNIMLDPYHAGGSFVFETKEELCFDVEQKYPNWKNTKAVGPAGKVEHISFWTKKYRCELYNREPVLSGDVVEHDYGFIPYVVIDTGLGNLSADNDLTKRYVGILRYVEGVLFSESRDYSIGDIILKKQAWPWGYLEGDNAQSVTDVFQKFGEYNTLPAGVKVVEMQPKLPPDALLTWLGAAANYLGAHAAPASVRGMGEQGVRAAADRRLLIAEASSRYTYSNEAFKHGIAKVLSNCARIMKNVVPGNIDVWARTPTDEFDIEIDKSKMKPPFTFYVEFAPISEEDEYRRHDDLIRLVGGKLVTVPWARRQMSNVDPIALDKEDRKESIRNSEVYANFLAQYFLQNAAQAAQPPGGQPIMMGANPPSQTERPLTTNVPNTALPGSAQEQQNMLQNMQSQIPMSATQGRGGGGS